MQIESDNQWGWKRWFPQTTVYHLYQLTVLDKLISKRHFEKMKYLFNVTSVTELKAKVEKVIQIKADKVERFHYQFPYIANVFDFEKIGSYN